MKYLIYLNLQIQYVVNTYGTSKLNQPHFKYLMCLVAKVLNTCTDYLIHLNNRIIGIFICIDMERSHILFSAKKDVKLHKDSMSQCVPLRTLISQCIHVKIYMYVYIGWGKYTYSCEYKKQFIHIVFILLFSVQTNVNILLPYPVYQIFKNTDTVNH